MIDWIVAAVLDSNTSVRGWKEDEEEQLDRIMRRKSRLNNKKGRRSNCKSILNLFQLVISISFYLLRSWLQGLVTLVSYRYLFVVPAISFSYPPKPNLNLVQVR